MSRQPRRLWFGDWRRDQETVASDQDGADTIVITQLDEGDSEPPERRRDVRRGVMAAVAIAALCVVAFAVFSGGNEPRVASQQTQVPPQQLQVPQTQVPQGAPPQGFGGPDLTGPAAVKAAEAAVARFPGDVERVTRGPSGGGYVVHVIQPDGVEVHVLLDDHFKIQGSDAGGAPSGFGSGTRQ